MHEIILEIIQRNYNEFTGTNEAETCSASEIASLVRGFEEWKDNMLFEDVLSYWQSSNLYNLWKEDRDNTGTSGVAISETEPTDTSVNV